VHFNIPDPHKTLSGKSTYDPKRRTVISSYMKHYNHPNYDADMDVMSSKNIIESSKNAFSVIQG
jgi:hypothetical protein